MFTFNRVRASLPPPSRAITVPVQSGFDSRSNSFNGIRQVRKFSLTSSNSPSGPSSYFMSPKSPGSSSDARNWGISILPPTAEFSISSTVMSPPLIGCAFAWAKTGALSFSSLTVTSTAIFWYTSWGRTETYNKCLAGRKLAPSRAAKVERDFTPLVLDSVLQNN